MIDLILFNALVRTMDASRPEAEAVAIGGAHIAAVGSNAEIKALAGPRTRLIDAGGRLVLPGFNDAHVHFLSGGFQLNNLDLRDARTPQEFVEGLRRFGARQPPGAWITGGQWDHQAWPGAPLPTRQWIDPVTPDRPVLIRRLDGHAALANSLALQKAGITKQTPDPPGGQIGRDPSTGEPTGLLKDAAIDLVSRVIPSPTFQQKLAAARAATQHAARLGVTSVQDMSADADVGLYQELARSGQLKTRIYAAAPLSQWERWARTGLRAGFGSDLLRVGALKGFSDGSLGASTALFFEPYADAPGWCGLPAGEMFPEGAMLERVRAADRAGLQVMIHAIGDRANAMVLAMFEQVIHQHGPRDRRFRIEHAQHLRPQDIPRFGRWGIIASMQPYHCADDGRWAEQRIGARRCQTSYAFRALLDTGATLAFGSDWPVAPLDPLQGIAAAVTRQTLDGRHPDGWVPAQKISVQEAVHAYTLGSAFAEFADQVKGSIAPGKLADLIMLDRDIFRIPPTEIGQAQVRLTIMNGQVVYEPP